MARSGSHGGDGQGASSGRGVGQIPSVPREPENSDRFQQLQDQITTLTAVVQQLIQHQPVAPTAPAPPVLPPILSAHVLGGDVCPSTVFVPTVVMTMLHQKKKQTRSRKKGKTSNKGKRIRYSRTQERATSTIAGSQQRTSRSCVFCGGPHRAITCDQRHGRCYKCGQAGHLVAVCPQRLALVQSTVIAPAVTAQLQNPAPSTLDAPPLEDLAGIF